MRAENDLEFLSSEVVAVAVTNDSKWLLVLALVAVLCGLGGAVAVYKYLSTLGNEIVLEQLTKSQQYSYELHTSRTKPFYTFDSTSHVLNVKTWQTSLYDVSDIQPAVVYKFVER